MPETISIYTPRRMIRVVEQLRPPLAGLLALFVNNRDTFETREVDVDVYRGKRRIAPFVSPRLPGTNVERIGRHVERYAPAYVKPFFIGHADDFLIRGLGERIETNRTPMQRAEAHLARDLTELDDMIVRREEQMIAQALTTGKVVVQGDGVNDEVDFLMAADHKVTLAGADLWSDAASDPLQNIRDWKRRVVKDSGRNARVMVCDSSVIDALLSHDDILKKLDNRRLNQGALTTVNVPQNGFTDYGDLEGLRILEYTDWWLDDAGVEQPMLPPGTAIIADNTAPFSIYYGVIHDIKVLRARIRHPKTWTTDNPSARYVQLISSPLAVMHYPDAIVTATVV